MDIVEQFKKDVAEDGCGDVGSLLDEIERLCAELAKQQSLTEAALQVAESAQRSAARDRAASQAREKLLREQKPAAWRHSNTHDLYDFEHEVELADAAEWAEPLFTLPTLPADDTALRALLAQRERETIERCANFVEGKFDFCGDELEIAEAIRALEVKP